MAEVIGKLEYLALLVRQACEPHLDPVTDVTLKRGVVARFMGVVELLEVGESVR
jgi:hypothetical protein